MIAGKLPMINTPWDMKFFKIGGVDFDLNTIEHEILRVEYGEPRIHFAINCASISCPKLRKEAFVPERIDQQLEAQTRTFLSDTTKNQLSTTQLRLSKIFNWFQSDFTQKQTLKEFLRKYTDVEITTNTKITYLDYNWALNE